MKTSYIMQYNFNNFILDKSNKLAYSSAVEIITKQPSILCIYGNNGTGKTHLMFSIVNEIQKANSNKNLLYISANDIIEELIKFEEKNILNKYKNLDMLLIDDIHFITGKQSIEKALLSLFDLLYQNGKQIIVSSDIKFKNNNDLEKKILKYKSSKIVSILLPTEELKEKIIKEFQNNNNKIHISENIKKQIQKEKDISIIKGILKTEKFKQENLV